jgi:hypothetical protein
MQGEHEKDIPDSGAPGDYGYDLAHEVPQDGIESPTPPPPSPEAGVQVATQTTDDGQDLGYDLSHDVPPPSRDE